MKKLFGGSAMEEKKREVKEKGYRLCQNCGRRLPEFDPCPCQEKNNT